MRHLRHSGARRPRAVRPLPPPDARGRRSPCSARRNRAGSRRDRGQPHSGVRPRDPPAAQHPRGPRSPDRDAPRAARDRRGPAVRDGRRSSAPPPRPLLDRRVAASHQRSKETTPAPKPLVDRPSVSRGGPRELQLEEAFFSPVATRSVFFARSWRTRTKTKQNQKPPSPPSPYQSDTPQGPLPRRLVGGPTTENERTRTSGLSRLGIHN